MSESFTQPLPNAQNPLLTPNFSQYASAGLVSLAQSPADVLAANPRVAATETVTLSTNPTNADVLTLTLSNPTLPSGSLAVSITASSDTTTTAAARLAAALSLNSVAMNHNIVGTSLANVLTVHQSGPVGNFTQIVFQSTGSTTAVLSNQASSTAVVGGSATSADVVTLVFTNANFAGGFEDVSYTVQVSDTLALVAAGLNSAINANVVLKANNISSTVSSETLTISQLGPNFATLSYTQGENSETLVFASLAGLAQGGSGPVIPFLNFNSSQGPMTLVMKQGNPVQLNSPTVADLVNSGSPVM